MQMPAHPVVDYGQRTLLIVQDMHALGPLERSSLLRRPSTLHTVPIRK